MTDNLRGALFMMAAMLGFAIEDALFKTATATVSPGLGTLIFGLTGLAAFLIYTRRSGTPLWSPTYLQPRLAIRSGFEVMGRLFFALSLAYTPLSTTSAILQAAPLVVTLGAALVLKEHVGPRRWTALLLGFVGVLIILRPSGAAFGPEAVFPILGMIGFACRDLATRTSPPEVTAGQLGILGFATIVIAGLVILAFEPGLPAPPTATAWACLMGTAIAGVAGYTALTQAMRTGEVSVVAPFRYSRLIVALIFAYAFFGERPDAVTLAGAALIVATGSYTLWRSGKAGSARQTALKPRS